MIFFRRLVDAFLLASVPGAIAVSVLGRPVLGAGVVAVAAPVFCARALFFRGENTARPRAAAGLLFVILVAALLPRLSNLSDNSLNGDELLWMPRGSKLVALLEQGRAAESTDHLSHPGVVPAYLIGCARSAFIAEGPAGGGLDRVTASRLPIACLGALTCVLLFLLGRMLWGDLPAFLGALFLALDPVHLGLSRVAHVDAALAFFFLLTILAYAVGDRRGSPAWKLASGVMLGFAILTKSPAFVLPVILVLWKLAAQVGRSASRRPLFSLSDLLVPAAAFFVYVALFPRLWNPPDTLSWFRGTSDEAPYRVIHGICVFVRRTRAAEIGAILLGAGLLLRRRRQTFRGRLPGAGWVLAAVFVGTLCLFRFMPNVLENMSLLLTRLAGLGLDMADPDRTPVRGGYETSLAFYPLVLLIRTPELLLLSTLVGGLLICARVVRDPVRARRDLLVPVTVIGMVVMMSFSRKMAMRYILPVQPFVCLLGGLAVAAACALARTRLSRGGRRVGRWPELVAACLVLAAALPAQALYFPNYYLYHNAFVGGAKGAADHFLVGWGEGYREVTQALKGFVTADANNVSVLGQDALVRYYWARGKPAATVHAHIGTTVFREADYLVTVRNEMQRRHTDDMCEYAVTNKPLHAVNLQGVDIAWIYRHERTPVTKTRIYKASSRQMDCEAGSRVKDKRLGKRVFAARGGKDEPGWLMRGPRRTYGPGPIRATFRLLADAPEGAGRLGTIDVAGGGDVFVAGDLTGADFPSAEDYVELALCFRLDRRESLEFRVYWGGNSNMRVYGVEVEPQSTCE